MATVTISPKYQVVIPKDVRDRMNLKPGQKVSVFQFDDRIELVPVRPIKAMRGFLRGIDTTVSRDKDRA
jgi:AbrB family looped-hinge helix DNA binding protein